MIDTAMLWNIRLINTQNAFGRLIDLNRRHHCSFIALIEPFQEHGAINKYKRGIGFDHAMVNCSSKIWIFFGGMNGRG